MSDGCGCCCEYVDIFRCEHLASPASATKDLWSTTADLPALNCDAMPRPSRIVAANTCEWFATAGRAGGVTIDVDIDATAIRASGRLLTSEKGTELVELGVLDNTLLASREVQITDAGEGAFTGYDDSKFERLILGGEEMNLIREPSFLSDRYDLSVMSAINEAGVTFVTATTPRGNLVSMDEAEILTPGIMINGLSAEFPSGGNPALLPGFTSTPPVAFVGNACGAISVYRDGVLVGNIKTTYGDLALELSEVPANASLQGSGTFDDPIFGKIFFTDTTTITNSRFRIKPTADGILVAMVETQTGWSFPSQPTAVTAGQSYLVSFVRTSFAYPEREATIHKIFLLPTNKNRMVLSESDRSLMAAQGSYLIVADHDETCEFARQQFTPASSSIANPLRSFASFVVLTEPPAVAFGAVDDSYVASALNALIQERRLLFSAFPSIHRNQYPASISNEFRTLSGENLSDSADLVRTETTDGNKTHVTETLPAVRDLARNVSFAPVVRQYTIHENDNLDGIGAVSRFLFSWEEAFEEYNSLVFQRPIPYVDLAFSRPVSGVTAEMFSIIGRLPPNGDQVTLEPVSVARHGGWLNRYRITLPTEEQDFNTQWLIVFSPTTEVGVWAGDMRAEEFETKDDFPTPGLDKFVYIDKSNGKEYLWEGEGYVGAGNSDFEEARTTRLKARFAWVIGKDKSIGRQLINTQSDTNRILNAVSSLTTTTTFNPPPGGPDPTMLSRVRTTENMGLTPAAGQFRQTLPLIGRETFVPRLPTSADTHTGPAPMSYFGLTTTIHPAPPAAVSICSVPGEAQKHSSLLYGSGDLRAITFSVVDAFGDAMSGLSIAGFEVFDAILGGSVGVIDFDWSEKTERYSITCEAELTGGTISQNAWAAEDAADLTATSGTLLVAAFGSTSLFNFDPPIVCSVKNIEMVVVASRSRLTYPGLMTTTLGQLVLTVFRRWGIEFEYPPGKVPPSGPRPAFDRSDSFRFVLTKNQEATLMLGQELQLESNTGTTWKLQGRVE